MFKIIIPLFLSFIKKNQHQISLQTNNRIIKPNLGEIGFEFKEYFKGYRVFEIRVIEIKINYTLNKDRRYVYSNCDNEDLSLKQLRY